MSEQLSEQKEHKGYRFCVVCSTYVGIKQQWIVVESQQRLESDLKTLSKQIEKTLQSLMNKSFACEAVALSAITDFAKTLNYYSLDEPKVFAINHIIRKEVVLVLKQLIIPFMCSQL